MVDVVQEAWQRCAILRVASIGATLCTSIEGEQEDLCGKR
jgi:hypothetical protein